MAEDIEAERVKIAMSLVDLLNYIVPGGTLLALIVVFEVMAPRGGRLPSGASAFWTTIEPFVRNDGWLVPTLLGMGVLLGAYVIGHVIDSVATLLIDRTLVYKGFGYPYQNLLRAERQPGSDEAPPADATHRWKLYSADFHQGTFFLLNLYLTLRWYRYFLLSSGSVRGPNDFRHALYALDGLLGLQFALKAACSVVRSRSTTRVQRLLIGLGFRGWIYAFARGLARCMAFPFDILSHILTPILNTNLSFNSEFRAKYKAQFERAFGLDPNKAESNNYWLSYCYVTNHSAALSGAVRRWETLYLFSRNLSVALFLFFVYVLLWMHAHTHAKGFEWADPAVKTSLLEGLALYVLAGLFLIHFYYLYVSYFSKLLYRSFVFLAEQRNPLGRVRGGDRKEGPRDGSGGAFDPLRTEARTPSSAELK